MVPVVTAKTFDRSIRGIQVARQRAIAWGSALRGDGAANLLQEHGISAPEPHQQRAGGVLVLGLLHVRLVERIDAQQEPRGRGGDLPAEELCASDVTSGTSIVTDGVCRVRSADPPNAISTTVQSSPAAASSGSPMIGTIPLPSFPVLSATSCSIQSPSGASAGGSRSTSGIGERTQPRGVRAHRLDRPEPSEPRRDRPLHGGIARPHVGAPRPERINEAALFQTSAGVVERAIERAWIDRNGHSAALNNQ